MAVITKITVQQKQKDRYNIFLDEGDGEKFAFSVDEDVLIKYQLKKGMELDEFSLTEIFFQDDIRKAYGFAVQYLAGRMRSECEVRQYLLKKEIENPIINEVIHKLYHQRFLNDEEFSIAYVRTQIKTTDKGPIIITKELKEKGISEKMIEKALMEYPKEDQLEKAIILAEKNSQKNNRDSSRIVKQKIEQMLMRKGYSYEIIQDVMAENDHDKNQQDELEVLRKQGGKLVQKYQNLTGYEFKQKIKQALFRKGFEMELIEQYLAEISREA